MSKNYEDLTLEELEALKKEREKQKLVNELKSEDAKIEAEKKEAERNALKEELRNEILKENPPASKIDSEEDLTKDNEEVSELESIFKQHIKASEYGFVPYEKQKEFNFENSDSGCDIDISDWSPADVYANIIWHDMYCNPGLRDICVKGIDVNAGDGLTVQIRAIGKFGAPSSAAACECVSCTSPALSTYSLTIGRYALVTEICDLDVFDAGNIYREGVLQALAKRWGEYFDAQIYSELETATPGTTVTLPTDICEDVVLSSCCTDIAAVLYNGIIELDASMREGTTPYRPDYVIISPTLAAHFKYAMGVDIPFIMRSQITVKDGVLTKLGHLKVIEYCGANDCTAGDVGAILIDSRRAVGFAFGKPPKLESDRNIECDSVTYAMNCYFGVSELDTDAIGHVVLAS